MPPKNGKKGGFFSRLFGNNAEPTSRPAASARPAAAARRTRVADNGNRSTPSADKPSSAAAPAAAVKVEETPARVSVKKVEEAAAVEAVAVAAVSDEVRAQRAAAAAAKAEGRVKLSSDVVPEHYNVTITPNLGGDFMYDGSMSVDMNITAPNMNTIVLHQRELQVNPCKFVGSDGVERTSTDVTLDESTHTVTFTFADALPEGKASLECTFRGEHNNQMAGFYRSSYFNAKGEKVTMVSTQFEALSARRAFPCVDEPAAKATFTATLIVPTYLTALGNMPESSVEYIGDGSMKKVSFLTTPRMSTYLLAFCVGEFDFCSAITEHGVLIRVFTPPTKCHLGRFALDAGKRCLDFYDDTFGVPYPLPKLDMVAIPEFSAGAMENWGLVTYREVELLIDDERASSQQKQRVCTVVTHELAHQWFGNLVTMSWWDDLWLNEGFAAWVQVYAADFLYPEWSMWEQFVINEQVQALSLDSLASSHPIQVPIKHAEEVEEVFDGISYAKGSCVVRMLFAYLGEEKFVEGLQLYMKRHQFSNTETYHLWAAWEDVSGKPVGEVMKSWTEQMGYPLVTINKATYSEDSVVLDLEQNWFLADGSKPEGHETVLWSIPLVFRVGDLKSTEYSKDLLMTERSMSVTLPLPAGADKENAWVKLNAGQHIPMRVAYSSTDIARLSRAIEAGQMETEDRSGLIQDGTALVKAGKMDAGQLINLMSAYKKEETMPVWTSIQNALGSLAGVLVDDEVKQKQFVRFAKGLVALIAAKVGWEPKDTDGHLGTLLRGVVVQLLEDFVVDSDESVRAEALRRFEIYTSDPRSEAANLSLPADLKKAVFRMVLKTETDPEYPQYKKLRGLLETAETIAEMKDIYLSMGATPSVELKKQILDWTTSGEVKLQDFFYPIFSVSSSGREGRDLSYNYLKDNYERIYKMVERASFSLMGTVVAFSCRGFCSDTAADDMEKFFASVNTAQFQRKVDQTIEFTRGQAAFAQRVQESAGFSAAMRDIRSVKL